MKYLKECNLIPKTALSSLNLFHPKKTPEQMFQDMLEGCTIYHDSEFPDSVFYMKNGEWWFELDSKNETLWCRYKYVWSVLETENNWYHSTTQSFIKKQVEERFKMMGVTPSN